MSYLPFSNKKAIKYFKKAINKEYNLKELYNMFHNLGRAYRKNGDYEDSLEMYNEALDSLNKQEYLEIATTYADISELYKEIGEYNLSLEYLHKALNIKEKILGKIHIETSISYIALGALYKDLGLYEKSLDLINRGIKIQESIYRERHPELLTSYGIWLWL